MDASFSTDLNYNSVENVPGYEDRATLTVNSASVFREDVDIVPTILDELPELRSFNLTPHRRGLNDPLSRQAAPTPGVACAISRQ